MQFGYFTLSDNAYRDNTRAPNQFVADIIDEAIYAEDVGLHSAWIGEHHFSTLGVLSCPDLALAHIAARTKRIRLAPAVTVLPLHHPIRVAEQWATLDLLSGGRVDFAAGRGYDRREYVPLGVSFDDNQSSFEEGMDVVRRLWSAGTPISHRGRHADFASRQALCVRRRDDHAAAGPAPNPSLCRVVLATVDRVGRAVGLRADRGAVRRGDELRRSAPGRRPVSRDLREARHHAGPADVQLLHAFRRYAG
jgi:alkanesulfonate monooxygenase SsuD/methylene tetrahydromethanopterin reductase-like flavin-dependent oxidoreductase (luciferase family)